MHLRVLWGFRWSSKGVEGSIVGSERVNEVRRKIQDAVLVKKLQTCTFNEPSQPIDMLGNFPFACFQKYRCSHRKCLFNLRRFSALKSALYSVLLPSSKLRPLWEELFRREVETTLRNLGCDWPAYHSFPRYTSRIFFCYTSIFDNTWCLPST